jgi:hypothetical protein
LGAPRILRSRGVRFFQASRSGSCMSPPVAIAVVILINVGVLVGGVIWLRRQMKRVVAERIERKREAGGTEL